MQCPPNDDITIFTVYPACKCTPLNTRPRSFTFELMNQATFRAAMAIIRSHIRDTGGLRRCNSQSDTSYVYRYQCFYLKPIRVSTTWDLVSI